MRQHSRLKSAYEVTRRRYKLGRRSSLAGASLYRWMRDARRSALGRDISRFFVAGDSMRELVRETVDLGSSVSLSLLRIILDTCLLSIFISHIQRTLASRVTSLKRMTSKSEVWPEGGKGI